MALRLDPPGRSLASVGLSADAAVGVGADDSFWKDWAEDRLDEVQLQIEVAGDRPGTAELRKELNAMANEVVRFYGYAEQHQAEQMNRSLTTLSSQQSKVRDLACGK